MKSPKTNTANLRNKITRELLNKRSLIEYRFAFLPTLCLLLEENQITQKQRCEQKMEHRTGNTFSSRYAICFHELIDLRKFHSKAISLKKILNTKSIEFWELISNNNVLQFLVIVHN